MLFRTCSFYQTNMLQLVGKCYVRLLFACNLHRSERGWVEPLVNQCFISSCSSRLSFETRCDQLITQLIKVYKTAKSSKILHCDQPVLSFKWSRFNETRRDKSRWSSPKYVLLQIWTSIKACSDMLCKMKQVALVVCKMH